MGPLLTGCAGFHSATHPYGVSHGAIFGDVTYPCSLSEIRTSTQVNFDSDDFEIIKTVVAETTSTNILGMFGTGDNGYAALFEEARAAGADDVVNIKMDTRTVSFLARFYTQATTKLTGTAIRWNKK